MRAASRSSRVLLVVVGEPGEQHDRVALRRRRCGGRRSRAGARPRCRRASASSCRSGAHRVDDAGMVAREPLERERAPSRGRPGCRPRARGAAARSSGGSGTARSRGRRLRAVAVVRRRAPRPRARRPTASAASASSRSSPCLGERVRLRRRLGERQAPARASGAPGRRSAPTAGSAGRCASARGCAPTSRRRARRRTSRARAAAGSPRRRARPPSRTRRSSRARDRDAAPAAPRARPASSSSATSTRGEPSSCAVRLEHARARVLGAVDAVAEAHDPLAARRAGPCT